MKVQRTSVGLDVHARSVVACGLDGETGEVLERRLTRSAETPAFLPSARSWARAGAALYALSSGVTAFGGLTAGTNTEKTRHHLS